MRSALPPQAATATVLVQMDTGSATSNTTQRQLAGLAGAVQKGAPKLANRRPEAASAAAAGSTKQPAGMDNAMLAQYQFPTHVW